MDGNDSTKNLQRGHQAAFGAGSKKWVGSPRKVEDQNNKTGRASKQGRGIQRKGGLSKSRVVKKHMVGEPRGPGSKRLDQKGGFGGQIQQFWWSTKKGYRG